MPLFIHGFCPNGRIQGDLATITRAGTTYCFKICQAERQVKYVDRIAWRWWSLRVDLLPFQPETGQQIFCLVDQSRMATQYNLLDLSLRGIAERNNGPHSRLEKLGQRIPLQVRCIGGGDETKTFVRDDSFTEKSRIYVAALIQHAHQQRERAGSDFCNLVDKTDSPVQHRGHQRRHDVIHFAPTLRVITEADSTGQVLRRHVLVPLEDEEVLAGTMSQLIDEAVLSHSRLASQKWGEG